MAAGAMRTVKSAVSRRRQAEDRHNHGGDGDTAASAFTNSEGTGVASGAFHSWRLGRASRAADPATN